MGRWLGSRPGQPTNSRQGGNRCSRAPWQGVKSTGEHKDSQGSIIPRQLLVTTGVKPALGWFNGIGKAKRLHAMHAKGGLKGGQGWSHCMRGRQQACSKWRSSVKVDKVGKVRRRVCSHTKRRVSKVIQNAPRKGAGRAVGIDDWCIRDSARCVRARSFQGGSISRDRGCACSPLQMMEKGLALGWHAGVNVGWGQGFWAQAQGAVPAHWPMRFTMAASATAKAVSALKG